MSRRSGVFVKKSCDTCGGSFEAKRSTAKYCSNPCRVQAQRAQPVAPVVPLPEPDEAADGPLGSVARAELAAVDREATAAGQLVLALARRIDSAEGESGASLAALVKEFRASLAAAVAGAQQAADPIDELRLHRDRKRQAR